MSVCAPHVYLVLIETRDSIGSLELVLQVAVNYQPGFWELKLGPLQEQQTAEPSSQPQGVTDNYIKASALTGTYGLLYKMFPHLNKAPEPRYSDSNLHFM